ncbi:MAG: acyl-CoA thioesterase [Anaerolineae bacterium]
MSDPVPVTLPIQIRWRDLDALAHVNNAVYLSYFELARLTYIRTLLGEEAALDRRTMLPAEFQFILAEVNIRYRSPATLGDQLAIAIWVSKVGRKSFVFEYRITETRTGRLVAEGCSTQVWYDYAAGASQPVPETIVARMEALQGAPIPRER